MHKFSKKILSTVIALTLVGSNVIPAIVYATDEISEDGKNILNDISNSAVQENISNENQEVSNNINETEQQIQWNQNAQVAISQELKRYLKYENKTLISFLVSSGIKDNTIPLLEKTIEIYVPKIQDKEPSKIIVSGKGYKYQDQILVINDKINDENTDTKELNWNSNDEILVTYIYDAQMEETTLDSLAVVSAKTIDERKIEAKTEETSYNVSEQVGNLLETNISGDKELNKGYLYTNINKTENKYETKFSMNYQINIGFIDLMDEIQVKESNLSDEVLTRKVTINKEELINIFGKDGSIKVLDSRDQELGVLKEDSLELNIESYGLKFITSKPITEGYINIKLEKVLNVNKEYTLELVENTNEIDESIDVICNLQGNEISNNHVDNKIALVEPSSNASISISKNTLSTVVINENVVITATLERNDITDALYKNPELLITLPSQITGINLKDARLIYEDELVPVTFQTMENKIYLRLEGIQTEYSSIPNVDGTVVKIVADLTLDNLAVNSDENIVLQYTNRVKDEIKSVETPVRIVAPTGFVTSNNGTVDETVSCISNDSILSVKANDVEKSITLGGVIVSNLKESTTGLMILGRFPTNEVKSIDEDNGELNSTYSINVNTPISVEGLDADIYYSDNGNATYDLTNEQNGWSLDRKDTSKSYLIVAKSEVTPAQKIVFNYNGTIPQNLDYENRTYSLFGIYYNNEAQEGVDKNVVVSKLLSIETENIPVIKTEIIARDYNTKEIINNGDKISGDQKYEYIIRATNTGRKAAENVTIIAKRPENANFYVREANGEDNYNDSYIDSSLELTKTVERINPGETIEFSNIISTYYNLEEIPVTFRAEVSAENMKENSTASFENTIVEGTIQLELYTENNNSDVEIGEEINYNLSITNHKSSSVKNLRVNINIPKYLELQNYEGANYNEETRTLSYNLDQLNYAKIYKFTAKVTSSDEPNQEIALVANADYEGLEKEIKSNTNIINVQDTKGFTATLSSNIAYKMLDTDTVEYYINVKNESKKAANISIYNKLPQELKIQSYIVKNGDSGYTENNPVMSVLIEEVVQAGENLKVTIVGKPYILDSVGQVKEIENKINLTINGINFDVNSIKQQIEGTSNFNTVTSGEEKEEKDNIYSISGKVWYDENGNSAQDEEEIGIPKVPLKLYNVNSKEYVKDEEGKEIQIYTDDNGNYVFENLENGEYIVSADYDEEVYRVANYQVSGLGQNEDNDFIESNDSLDKQEEKSFTAATNTIMVSGENVYNTDLGLIDTQNFNIVLNNRLSKVSVVKEGKTTSYDVTNELKIDAKELRNSTIIVEYLLEVTNRGNIDGYVTQIASNISEGMQFISELNKDWYINSKGEAINTSIANKLIKSGETETLKLVLIKELNNNKETIQSTSEIRETYNQYGIEEITKSNLQDSKAKSAQLIISESQENSTLQIIIISLSILAIISLIGVGVYKSLNKYLKKLIK